MVKRIWNSGMRVFIDSKNRDDSQLSMNEVEDLWCLMMVAIWEEVVHKNTDERNNFNKTWVSKQKFELLTKIVAGTYNASRPLVLNNNIVKSMVILNGASMN